MLNKKQTYVKKKLTYFFKRIMKNLIFTLLILTSCSSFSSFSFSLTDDDKDKKPEINFSIEPENIDIIEE